MAAGAHHINDAIERRAEIDALADTGLEPVRIEDLNDPQLEWPRRWRAEFTRPGPASYQDP